MSSDAGRTVLTKQAKERMSQALLKNIKYQIERFMTFEPDLDPDIPESLIEAIAACHSELKEAGIQ